MTELDKPYTDKQLEKEFPLRKKICAYDKCKKPFLTRYDAKYHSDKCFVKDIRSLRKSLGTWVKNEKRVKSTHRPDKTRRIKQKRGRPIT